MSFEKVFEKIAWENNTSPEQVRYEIQTALRIAGIEVPCEVIIELIAQQIKTIYRK